MLTRIFRKQYRKVLDTVPQIFVDAEFVEIVGRIDRDLAFVATWGSSLLAAEDDENG